MTLRIAITVFLAIIIVIAAFAFFTPHANRNVEQAPLASGTAQAVPTVSLTDAYGKGIHTISGSILAPTPCTTVTAEAMVASGTPEMITIALAMPPDAGICLQRATPTPFKLQAAASADAVIDVEVNGVNASTTVKSL